MKKAQSTKYKLQIKHKTQSTNYNFQTIFKFQIWLISKPENQIYHFVFVQIGNEQVNKTQNTNNKFLKLWLKNQNIVQRI